MIISIMIIILSSRADCVGCGATAMVATVVVCIFGNSECITEHRYTRGVRVCAHTMRVPVEINPHAYSIEWSEQIPSAHSPCAWPGVHEISIAENMVH